MCIEDLTKVYLFEKYEDEKKVVLTCSLCVLDLEYKKAKETLFFAFQEDIIDDDEFKCLIVELKDLYFSRKYSYVSQTDKDVVNEVKESAKAEVFTSLLTCVLNEFSRVMKHDIPLCDKEEANLTYYFGYFKAAFEFGVISEDRYEKMCDELTELFNQKEDK